MATTTYSVLKSVDVEVRSKRISCRLFVEVVDQSQHVERKHPTICPTFVGHSVQ